MESPCVGVVKDSWIEFTVNPDIYALDVVYATCYRFIDNMYVYLDQNQNQTLVAALKYKQEDKNTPEALQAIMGEFNNELLNVAFRKDIAFKNKGLREMLVSQALFAANPDEMDRLVTGLDDDFDLSNDLGEDPHGITQSWEEKYGVDRVPDDATDTEIKS